MTRDELTSELKQIAALIRQREDADHEAGIMSDLHSAVEARSRACTRQIVKRLGDLAPILSRLGEGEILVVGHAAFWTDADGPCFSRVLWTVPESLVAPEQKVGAGEHSQNGVLVPSEITPAQEARLASEAAMMTAWGMTPDGEDEDASY